MGGQFAHKDGHSGCIQTKARTEDGLLHERDVDPGKRSHKLLFVAKYIQPLHVFSR